jgi:hypothetical protein
VEIPVAAQTDVPKLTHTPKPIEVSVPPLRLAVYGEPGAGKTTLALSFPNPLVISIDNGLEGGALDSLANGGEEWTPEDWRDLNALYFWLKGQVDKKGYDTVVIDSITSLSTLIRHEAMRQPAQGRAAGQADLELVQATQPDYGRVAYALENFLLKLTQLSQLTGVHVVLTSNVREPDTDKGQTKRSFDLQPAVERIVLQWANIYGELVAEEVDDPADKDKPARERRKIERRVLWTRVQDPRRKNKTRFAALTPGVVSPTFERINELIEDSITEEPTPPTTGATNGKSKSK